MFYTTASALSSINKQLAACQEPLVGRTCFYRLRQIYCLLYGQAGRMQYDQPALLYLYYCAKARNRIGRHDLLLRYMKELDEQLARQKQCFCDLYGSFSAINTHFLQAQPLVA